MILPLESNVEGICPAWVLEGGECLSMSVAIKDCCHVECCSEDKGGVSSLSRSRATEGTLLEGISTAGLCQDCLFELKVFTS